MQSVCSQSASSTVVNGTPMVFDNAAEVLLWHMFELPGRLLCPVKKAANRQRRILIHDASADALFLSGESVADQARNQGKDVSGAIL
jgi:hypothetical protein